MRGFKTFALVATASVLLAGSLQAQWTGKFNWGGHYNTNAYYQNANGLQTWGTVSSPYMASFSSVVATGARVESNWYLPPSGTTVDIFCVDLLHTVNRNGYDANFTNLANTDSLGHTTRNASQIKYMQAAYLAQKIGQLGSADYGSADAQDMTGAIWEIMTTGAVMKRWWDGEYRVGKIHEYVDEAEAHYGSVIASNWVVVTDRSGLGANGGGQQEFLTQVTPEPATMLLLGTGLVVMLMAAGALRRPVA